MHTVNSANALAIHELFMLSLPNCSIEKKAGSLGKRFPEPRFYYCSLPATLTRPNGVDKRAQAKAFPERLRAPKICLRDSQL
jgi:hypothetical protein